MTQAKTTWDGQVIVPKPKGPEPLKVYHGIEANKALVKSDEPEPKKELNPEQMADLTKQIEAQQAIYTDPGQLDSARNRANQKAHELIIEKQGGNEFVKGNAEGHSRRVGEPGAESRGGGTFTLFSKTGFNAKHKNRFELFHKKEGAK